MSARHAFLPEPRTRRSRRDRGRKQLQRASVILVALALVGSLLAPAPAYAVDDTSIAGAVRDPGGDGVADATVEFFDATGDGSASVQSVVTAADGSYAVSGLPIGTYRLRASADPAVFMPRWYTGYLTFATATDLALADGNQLTAIDVYLTDATDSIEGVVRDPGGTGVANATVEFFDAAGDGSSPVTSVVSAADGSYSVSSLPFGTYRVRASADAAVFMPRWYTGYLTFDTATDLALVDGTHLSAIDVYLTDATDSIEGVVRDPGGTGIANATVDVFDAAGTGLSPVRSVATAADGSYSVTALPFGTYRLRASADAAAFMPRWYSGYLTFDTATDLALVDGTHLAAIDVYLTDATDSIEGVVRDPGGTGIANATVEFFDATGDGSSPVSSVVSAADGSYVVSSLPFGTYRLRASADAAVFMPRWYTGYLTFDTATDLALVDGTHLSAIDVYLTDATDSIEGVVRDPGGTGIANATVEFFDATGDGSSPVSSVVSAADGSYVVSSLPFGTYRLRASADAAVFMPRWYTGYLTFDTATDLALVDGTHLSAIDVYLTDATDSIEGVVRDPGGTGIANATVDVFDAAGTGLSPVRSVATAADGSYSVTALPFGTYRLRASADPGLFAPRWYSGYLTFAGATDLSVVDGTHYAGIDVYLEPAAGVALISGVVSDGLTTGPLAGASVELYAADGDGTTPVRTAVTDALGQYAFTGLTPGVYRVKASAAGRIALWYYLALNFADAFDLNLTGGGTASAGFTLYDSANGISGHVYRFDTGAPVAGATVEAFVASPPGLTPIATTVTDTVGAYAFSDLPAGSYRLRFSGGPSPADVEWYSNADSSDSANVIGLGAADHQTSIDAHVGDTLAAWQATPVPVISGTPAVGSTLTAIVGTWLPAPDSLDIQWKKNGLPLAGATGSTFTIPADARGSKILFEVTATKAGYATVTLASDPVSVPAFSAAELAAAMEADGTMLLGVEADGLAAAVGTGSLGSFPRAGGSYVVLSTGDAVDAAAAHEPDYGLSTDLADAPSGAGGQDLTRLTLTLSPPPGAACLAVDFAFGSDEYPQYVGSAYNDVFTFETPSSNITLDGSTIVAPNNRALDSAGQILSINTIVGFAPIAGNGINGWTPGLTARAPLIEEGGSWKAVFSLQDIGDSILDSVVLLDNLRYLNAADCAGGGGATPIDPIVGSVPVIVGTPNACEALTVLPGAWTPAPVSLSYQWTVSGVAVPGETGTSFLVPGTSVGEPVAVVVTGSKPGYVPVSHTSVATSAYILCDLTGPVPTISGDTALGSTLTLDTGGWEPSPVDVAVEWQREGIVIPGETGTSLVLGAADAGAEITASVTGSKPGYSTLTMLSAAVTIGTAPVLSPTPVPVVVGSTMVGETLTASVPPWGPAPVEISYQWLRNGVAVAGETGVSMLLGAADLAATITVAVTGSKVGYESVTRTSLPTVPITAGLLSGPVPTIAGVALVGSTLTVNPGSWTPGPVTLAIRWLRDGVPIADATGTTLLLGSTDAGTSISVSVTGTRSGYATLTRVSTAVDVPGIPVLEPTPVPTVSGLARVGETLTAASGTWGPAPVELSYQWQRDGLAISGETGVSLVLGAADLGAVLAVAVTGAKAGYASVSRTSPPTVAVVAGILSSQAPVITGSAVVGSTLTVTTGTWGPAPVTLAIQWFRDGVAIPGANASSLLLGAADLGAIVTVEVSGSKTAYGSITRAGTGTSPVVAGTLIAPVPTISGTGTVGSTLTVDTGTWGPSPVGLSVQWLRNGGAIPGETGATILLAVIDGGTSITVSVTGSKPGYTTATRQSAAVEVAGIPVLSPTPVPTISGLTAVGGTLSASPGTWGPAPVELTYQWLRDGAAVAGETSASILLGVADLAAALSVTVTGARAGYAPVSQTSAPTAPIGVGTLSAPLPTVSGSADVGSTLTVDTGAWGPTPLTLAIQWLRNGTPLAGQSGSTLLLGLADGGTSISVSVTGGKPGYTTVTRTSVPVVITVPALSPAPVPTISGGVMVGSTLTANSGSWGPAPVELSYQWLRDGVAVAGATGVTFALGAAELGASMSVAVTGARAGYTSATRASAATGPVAAGILTAPAPSVAGNAVVGSTLTVDPGTWGPAAVSLAIQWFRDGAPIAGATGSALLLGAVDLGAVITVEVTGSKTAYGTITRSGSPTAPIDAGTLTAPVPTVTGSASIGSTLTVDAGVWDPAPVTLGLQWLRNGIAIPGETGATLLLGTVDGGTAITVSVTGTKPGYSTVTRVSAPVTVLLLAPTPVPTISGVAAVGQTLTAASGSWGPAPVELAYQWLRDGAVIPGANGVSLTLGAADLATAISVAVTGSKVGFGSVTRTSLPTSLVAAGTLTAPTPSISGSSAVGSTLTILSSPWGPGAVGLQIQWLRDGVPIDGATGLSLILTATELGTVITVEVTGTKPAYNTITRSSAGTSPVGPGTLAAPTPVVSGTAVLGGTLTATAGAWGPAPVALAYQWLRNGVAIPGATATTYTPVVADVGAVVAVTVTGTRTGYVTASRTSTGTGPIAAGTLTAPIPTVSGTVAVGSVLTALPGAWGPAPVTLSYAWRANGALITGATGSTYTVTAANIGAVLTVTVTGSKPGYTTVSRTSAPTIPVPSGCPTTTPVPTISGSVTVGSILTAQPGTWAPAPISLTYQWRRDGAAMTGATGTTYTVRVADIGSRLTVTVTGSKSGCASVARTSAQTDPVPAQAFTAAPVPTISGTLRVGNQLTPNPGSWQPSPVQLSYQWRHDGVNIPGATKAVYLLTGADFDRNMTVVVVGTRTTYATTTRISAPTTAILPGFMTSTPTPWITGTAKVGKVLSVHTGQWEPSPVPVVFTWRRNGVAIPGATGGSAFWDYKVVTADVGKRITCTVTSTKTGYVSVTKLTAATAIVTAK
ncbi:carboxypeptidase regulatory-like domain-containing protein [Cryobacterium tagatosivorans]|uniref:carboxypeptidase regulatory-like domain-containing protein n=1 Tax=Cryobacterium tagatosivorans TaxID=1259199 RepID=UPI00141A86F2|nr:carboxypeptidase regulatory-like domain-containing protein [Cryobacterium tagatosivorans]